MRELPARDHGGLGTGPRRRSTPASCCVRISAFGQDGPYAKRPGLDRLGVAYGGLLNLTGEPDRPPVRPGVTVADYLTGVFAAEAALAALYRRDADGPGDGAAGPGPGCGHRRLAVRVGAAHPGMDDPCLRPPRDRPHAGGQPAVELGPARQLPDVDGNYVCVVAGGDANFARLCRAMGRLDLLDDPRFATLADRARNGDTINASGGAVDFGAERGRGGTRPASPTTCRWRRPTTPGTSPSTPISRRVTISSPSTTPSSARCASRRPIPGWSVSRTPVPSGAPVLGAHNREVWCDLVGLTPAELEEMQAKGIV